MSRGARQILPLPHRILIILGPVIILFSCVGSTTYRVDVVDVTSPHRAYNAVHVLGENHRMTVIKTTFQDTLPSIAETFYGDARMSWLLMEQNKVSSVNQGDIVVIPKVLTNQIGISTSSIQTVPILSYHRFGPASGRLTLSAEVFRKQLSFLQQNGFTVIPLKWLDEFVRGKRRLPPRSVVITIDDGYRSAYRTAYPLLKEFDYPATIFIYSDFIQYGGLTWKEVIEMQNSGLISIQAHSKTHRNLSEPQGDGAPLEQEILAPKRKLEQHTNEPVYAFAYPFGAATHGARALLDKHKYTLGLSVTRGSNTFYNDPLFLHRTMIYSDDPWERFVSALKTQRDLSP